jgi:selenocysteine lyase/cysteine desulfurase
MNLLSTFTDHASVRSAFPGLSAGTYLNVGTYGIMPEPALEAFLALVQEYETFGLFSTSNIGQKVEATRERVAALLGCAPAQIAFTGNATDGTNLLLAGLAWEAGDEVIITDEEHEAIVHPLLYLQCTRQIRVHRIPVSPDAEVMQRRCAAVASPRTRLLAFSHVTCESGTRLPAAAMCRWAAENDILSLVDGAQSLGVVQTRVEELGCDCYTGNGHKWLCGPKGTGIFYAAPHVLQLLSPAHVGAGSLELCDIVSGTAQLWSSGRRFEYGTRAGTLIAGLDCSLVWLEALGWGQIESYASQLSSYLKAAIQERPYLQMLTPASFEEAAGLTTFVMEGWNAGELSQEMMRRAQIRVRVIPHFNGIRISTACFNNEGDIDALLAIVDAIAEEGTYAS